VRSDAIRAWALVTLATAAHSILVSASAAADRVQTATLHTASVMVMRIFMAGLL